MSTVQVRSCLGSKRSEGFLNCQNHIAMGVSRNGAKRQFVIRVTGGSAAVGYCCRHRMREIPMLKTTYRQTRETISEWRRRARSRRELAMLGPVARLDLGWGCVINAEMSKPFWQA